MLGSDNSDVADPQGLATGASASWAPEFHLNGKWSRNGLRFGSKSEALGWADSHFMRWTMPDDYRATPAAEAVNYRFEAGRLIGVVTTAASQ